ncbi:CatB-related O-acetyltransferase [Pseudohalocynthiibacter aestuariivivens]|nr:CatB-related O-acetyltransferase [Pseudohalocynthiibacter aestuariivivens]QIE47002.1 CatB-related O-acetyltransferase [Pseudohalocynthiibacter aestuariivivens]
MPQPFPDPDNRNPLTLPDGTRHQGTVFLRAAIDHPRIEVGEYSYASAHEPPDDWAASLAPYLYPHSPEKLIIGRFCQIADGVQFITASANHRHDGFSTYPFAIFDGGFAEGRASLPGPGRDTQLGHDIWIGEGARVLPGAVIGSGAIIGAGAVVGGHVPPYSVVTGNPGRTRRRRFTSETIARLLEVAWWDWPIEDILTHETAICDADLTALERAAACVGAR